MQNSVAITILGKEYKVKTGGDEVKIRQLSEYINNKVLEIQKSGTATSTMDLVAIVMLSMADDVDKARMALRTLQEDVESKAGRMADRIEDKLNSSPGVT